MDRVRGILVRRIAVAVTAEGVLRPYQKPPRLGAILRGDGNNNERAGVGSAESAELMIWTVSGEYSLKGHSGTMFEECHTGEPTANAREGFG